MSVLTCVRVSVCVVGEPQCWMWDLLTEQTFASLLDNYETKTSTLFFFFSKLFGSLAQNEISERLAQRRWRMANQRNHKNAKSKTSRSFISSFLLCEKALGQSSCRPSNHLPHWNSLDCCGNKQQKSPQQFFEVAFCNDFSNCEKCKYCCWLHQSKHSWTEQNQRHRMTNWYSFICSRNGDCVLFSIVDCFVVFVVQQFRGMALLNWKFQFVWFTLMFSSIPLLLLLPRNRIRLNVLNDDASHRGEMWRTFACQSQSRWMQQSKSHSMCLANESTDSLAKKIVFTDALTVHVTRLWWPLLVFAIEFHEDDAHFNRFGYQCNWYGATQSAIHESR